LEAPEAPSGRVGRLSTLAGKAGWNLADQILSSLTNIVLSVLVANSVGKQAFGAFTAALLVFSLLIAMERALVGQVLSIRHSDETPDAMRVIAARALGTVATLAVPASVVLVVIGFVLHGYLREAFVTVGVAMPALLLQDASRMIFFAQSKAQHAALNDAVWAAVQFPIMGILIATGTANVPTLILAWGGSAAIGVVLAIVQLRAVPRLSAGPGWVRQHRDLLAYLLPENLTTSGGDKAAYFAVLGIIGEAGLGAVGAARQLLNPMLIVSSAAASFAMPEISRRGHLSPRARVMAGVGLGGLMGAITLLYLGFALLVLPLGVGDMLFSDTWAGARTVLLPMGLFSVAGGTIMGPFLVIASMGHAKRTFRVTVLQTVLMVIFMPLGAYLGGAPGAAWGLLAGKIIEMPFWFGTLLRVAKEGPAPAPDDAPATESMAQ
jgi:O-antigen/teichoic acid export membrane protein